jgi:hypothetical protein
MRVQNSLLNSKEININKNASYTLKLFEKKIFLLTYILMYSKRNY